MVRVFSWNNLDVLFTFNFDHDLQLTFSQDLLIDFFNIMTLTGTTSYSTYLIDRLQLNLEMVGIYSWNDVDVFFTLNIDLELKLTFPKVTKDRFFQHYDIGGYHFVLSIETLLIEPLNLDTGRSI